LSADKISGILGLKSGGKIPKITHLIYFDDVKPEDQVTADAVGVKLIPFSDVL
jgi:hypothetical protein